MASPLIDLTLRAELDKVWIRKWWVVACFILSGLVGYVASSPWIMKPKFSSTAALVPPSFDQLKSVNYRFSYYLGVGSAEEEDLEILVNALSSDTIMQKMDHAFNLTERYDLIRIENLNKRAKKFKDVYADHVTVNVSSFSTVEVVVYDEDPVMAYKMNTYLVQLADSFVENVSSRQNRLYALKNKLIEVDMEFNAILDSISFLREKYNIYNLSNLPDPIGNILIDAFSKDEFSRYYDYLIHADNLLFNIDKSKNELNDEINSLQVNISAHPSFLMVAGAPTINYNKVKPNRVVIVMLSVLGGLLFGVFLALFLENNVGEHKPTTGTRIHPENPIQS